MALSRPCIEPDVRWQRVVSSRYAQLELAVATASHVLLAALPARGPRVATERFVPLLDATLAHLPRDAAWADGGYDSEPNQQ